MKKILSLILSLALSLTCVIALVGCGECEHADENGDKICDKCSTPYAADIAGYAKTIECYKNSLPTKVVTTSLQNFYDYDDDGEKIVVYDLESETVLVTGKSAGLDATVETSTREVLRDVVSSDDVIGPIQVVESTREYLQGFGVRTSGDDWVQGTNFAPRLGSIGIDITLENVWDATYTEQAYNNVFSFTVKKEDVAAVFGKTIKDLSTDSDIKVSITNDGAVVTGISISYTMKAFDNFPERSVEINVTYGYDVEVINIVQ